MESPFWAMRTKISKNKNLSFCHPYFFGNSSKKLYHRYKHLNSLIYGYYFIFVNLYKYHEGNVGKTDFTVATVAISRILLALTGFYALLL